MSSDLANRLRKAKFDALPEQPIHPVICDEAAKEIVRLVKVLFRIRRIAIRQDDHRLQTIAAIVADGVLRYDEPCDEGRSSRERLRLRQEKYARQCEETD